MGRGRPGGREAGMALPMAVLALALVGALAASSFVLGLSDLRAGRATLALADALGRADVRAAEAVLELRPADLAAIPLGSTVADPSGGDEAVAIGRLSTHVFLVSASAEALQGGVARRVAILVRLEAPALALGQALSTPGAVALDPFAGVYQAPPDSPLSCRDPARPAEPGEPQEGYVSDGYEDLAIWASRATVTLPEGSDVTPRPLTSGAACVTEDTQNWGDPADPEGACGLHFPVVHVPGDLAVRGGVGQGVLVVDGDLDLEGEFDFRGVVLVGGELRTGAGGAAVAGAVQVGAASGGGVTLGSGTLISHSPCAIEEAVLAFGGLVPLRERALLRMY